ncbi:hypothetical protein D3C83_129350 [compost metagenome]
MAEVSVNVTGTLATAARGVEENEATGATTTGTHGEGSRTLVIEMLSRKNPSNAAPGSVVSLQRIFTDCPANAASDEL